MEIETHIEHDKGQQVIPLIEERLSDHTLVNAAQCNQTKGDDSDNLGENGGTTSRVDGSKHFEVRRRG